MRQAGVSFRVKCWPKRQAVSTALFSDRRIVACAALDRFLRGFVIRKRALNRLIELVNLGGLSLKSSKASAKEVLRETDATAFRVAGGSVGC